MSSTDFLHGVEVLDIDDGSRTISVASSSVIGIVGTAPNADPTLFPLNTPVIIAGSTSQAAGLSVLTTSVDNGTLPSALDSILKQSKAVVIVVRVAVAPAGADQADEQRALIIGGTDAQGNYTGCQAFVGAEHITGAKPRILIAPGFTHQRVTDGVASLAIDAGGTGFNDGTWPLVFTNATGTGAAGTATVAGGIVTATSLTAGGYGYKTIPAVTLDAGAGAGIGLILVATTGSTANAPVANLIGIANSLRAVIIADGPSTTDDDVIAYAGDFGSKRVYLVDPQILKTDSTGATVNGYGSAVVAGIIAATDNAFGFWWSPSNQTANGVIGTARTIDFVLGDSTCRANLLNAANVAVFIRQNGFRLWGNRTLSSDPKWAFLSIVRTADIIADSLQAGVFYAIDRGITKNFVTDVIESVNAFLRNLKAKGAILGGKCWADPELNTPDQIAAGHTYFDFDFGGVNPNERMTLRSHLVNDYIASIFDPTTGA